MSVPVELRQEFENKLKPYSESERQSILSAVDWAVELHSTQTRASGEPYIIHPLAVAEILIGLRLDSVTIIAAILHDILEDTSVSREVLGQRFGGDVELLVEGVTKIALLRAKSKSVQNAETIRKMLFAMVKDIRVILIKLADKLHNMRTLEYLDSEKGRRIAQECLDIYSPLAGRLGISWIKDELEDLALKTLQPGTYRQIQRHVSEKRIKRSGYLDRIKKDIYRATSKENIRIEIKTRAKHFYSIYQKMKKRGKGLDEIYDLLGIRILCRNTVECYTLLGLVHELWKPLAGRFKDYIAMPKSNRYQSLHTTVMGYEGRLIEIQIRTREMNQTAEYGIAAHWFYKMGAGGSRPKDLTIINKLRRWNQSLLASSNFLEEIKSELLRDSIYVFTPKGDVVELPKGATPLDFAYRIHTEVGHHCQGAKADGNILPLKKALRNTQVVEVITSPKAHPRLNWLRYAQTHRARSKIRQWLNKHDENLIPDRNIVVRSAPDGFPVNIKGQTARDRKNRESMRIMDPSRVGIRIGREKNFMIKMAQCCNPATGESIVGYVSRGRGIIVHRSSCRNLSYIKDFRERFIEVEWETCSNQAVKRFKVTARAEADLFSEIEGAIKKYQGHLIAGKLQPDMQGTLTGYFTIEMENSERFKEVLKNLRTIPAVINIHPSRDGG
ncbi:MAG TPA: bifunctional (p)ppGpp synthetase/guanosine-3',5'-bis(diphosphate) 3'-pyrophosphohydrolase [Spirochaetia bacterium]|nr:bifunctional (p)ppGpp synthetase/guanosine-3',5'-bis(diphosphate) 3'-pyrophosphohydrolase [Spirochaetia bacterium]